MQLEEFRKKKAAKKALSTNASEVNSNEKQPLENDHATVTDTAVAGSSGGQGTALTDPSSTAMNSGNIYINDHISISSDQPHSSSNDQ